MVIAFTDEIIQRKYVKYKGKRSQNKTLKNITNLKKVMFFVSHKGGKNVKSQKLAIECLKQDRGDSWSLIR